MLFAINSGQVEGYREGQNPVLHLVSSAEAVAEAELSFTYTESHAEMKFSQFYDDLEGLRSRIDWEIMQSRFWNDEPPEIVDRKRKRQAEFLVHRFFPWRLVGAIGVINEAMREEVLRVVAGGEHQPEVRVQRGWYY